MARSAVSARTSETALVAAWDAASGQPAWRRALTLVTVLDGASVDHLPVGAVSARVLACAQRLAVQRVDTTAHCGPCEERLDVSLGVDDLLAGAPDVEADPAPFTVEVGERRWRVRLPTPADLAAVATSLSVGTASRALLRRCVLDAGESTVDDESAVVIAAEMAHRDPFGVITIDVTCVACGSSAPTMLDVPHWWWTVVDTWVRRLFGEVHRLARAYGWTEPEVLALGPRRRRAYLELVP